MIGETREQFEQRCAEKTQRRREYDAPWLAAHDLLSNGVSPAIWSTLVQIAREERPDADLTDPEQLRSFLLLMFEKATEWG